MRQLTLGELIRKRRKELGLTQTELANLVGVTASIISRLENGENKGTNIINIKKLAEALCMSPNELAFTIEQKPKEDN